MNDISPTVNCIQRGQGPPVLLLHGLAASLRDWDLLLPVLAEQGYTGYALDLLGHGDSAKPKALEFYTIEHVFQHTQAWIDSLKLDRSLRLIGHSLGGYLALKYALRYPGRVRALILVNPFYSIRQLPPALRLFFRRPLLNTTLIERTPYWLFRALVDLSSITFGASDNKHSLPESVRVQTAVDYKRASPNIFNIPRTLKELNDLQRIQVPTLVLWGEIDQSLAPDSFQELVHKLPNAVGKALPAGHVPHQSNVEEFNHLVLEFLRDH